MYTKRTETFHLNENIEISIETGKLAKQADGSVVVRIGDTMLLATVVAREEAAENVDFMPLSVDYQEKYAALGRFPGGFFKREARPSEYEILISRLIDRALRPMFPDDFHAETQVLVFLISADKDTSPDAYAALAASSALMVSDIPFHGPISEVRVAYINGEFVINPSISDLENAELDLVVAATLNDITMVEGEMKEVSEEIMIEALRRAHDAIKIQCNAQLRLAQQVEKAQLKREYCHEKHDEELKQKLTEFCQSKIMDVARQRIANKKLRSESFHAIQDQFAETIDEEIRSEKMPLIKRYFHDLHKEVVRQMVLEDRLRLDGRKLDEIRPIWGEVDYLPSAHGSSIFTRGETQSLTTITLGTSLDEQIIDGVVFEGKNRFMLHYNFPPFSTGENKMLRTGRREVGHGNLALRALKPMLPPEEENAYTIRVVSDILESNGSSSMATVCAGSMALMDAGIKLKKPVSGIAMGLITDKKTGKYAVLSDILGDEDHLGDMDFKVTGTKDGVTACQMDIKIEGLSYEILTEALAQAKRGREHILGEMNKVIQEPRADYKPQVPRFAKVSIPREFIGAVIGPGGKHIQELQRATNSTIVIQEVGDFGMIDVFALNVKDIEAVLNRIKMITAIPEIGEVYEGIVKSILDFGVFVEILPGKEGLLHISEIDWKHVKDAKEYFKQGDQVSVKLIDIDSKTGKMKLSRKVMLPKPDNFQRPQQ
jgi:polyribonucleotide nucleotidyltransferase